MVCKPTHNPILYDMWRIFLYMYIVSCVIACKLNLLPWLDVKILHRMRLFLIPNHTTLLNMTVNVLRSQLLYLILYSADVWAFTCLSQKWQATRRQILALSKNSSRHDTRDITWCHFSALKCRLKCRWHKIFYHEYWGLLWICARQLFLGGLVHASHTSEPTSTQH